MSTKKNSKKGLLNEAVVRKFMKLAKLQGLSENFVSRLHEEEEEPKEEEEEELPPPATDDGGELPPLDHTEPDGDEGVGAGSEDLVKELADAIATAISQVTGVSVSVSSDQKGGDMPSASEPPAEPPAALPPASPGLPPDEEEEEEESPLQEAEASPPSGDRSQFTDGQHELPDHDVVTEDKVEENKSNSAAFGGKGSGMKLKKAPAAKKLEESKKMSKEQMLREIARRVMNQLQGAKK